MDQARNVAEATFAWSFTPTGSASGPVVTVPAAATAFTLTATCKGGYTTTMSGPVLQVALVPNFSLSPSTALINSSITLTNTMQKSAQTTLNGVEYAINQSATPPGGFDGSLPASFNAVNGTGTVLAPGTAGNYFLHLRYTHTVSGGAPQTATVSKQFSTTTFVVSPQLVVYTDQAGNTVASFQNGVFQLTNSRASRAQ